MDTDVGDEEFVKALGPKGAMAAVSQPAATSKEKDEGGWHTAKRSKTKHPALTISSDSGSVKLAAIQELILWGLQLSNADPRRFGLVLEHRNHLARIVVVIIEARGAACSYLLLWLLLASSVKRQSFGFLLCTCTGLRRGITMQPRDSQRSVPLPTLLVLSHTLPAGPGRRMLCPTQRACAHAWQTWERTPGASARQQVSGAVPSVVR
jgi:hypothetical protein